VIAVALALPLGLYVLLNNIQAVSEGWDTQTSRVSLYLKTSIDDVSAARLANSLGSQPGVAKIQLITREEALKEYREQSGFGDTLAALGENPLPAVILLDPVAGADVEALAAQLRGLAEVEMVKLDLEWLQRLQAITTLAQRAVQVIATVLGFAVLIVAGNAIRIAVAQRRDEIEIVKLFGATDAFVRRPFLYSGFLYGALGGLVACGIVALALGALADPVRRLASLYEGAYALKGLSWQATIAVTLASGLLGLMGAWWTAAYHVRQIDVK